MPVDHETFLGIFVTEYANPVAGSTLPYTSGYNCLSTGEIQGIYDQEVYKINYNRHWRNCLLLGVAKP